MKKRSAPKPQASNDAASAEPAPTPGELTSGERKPRRSTLQFPVVGIGASAGGLYGLKAFLEQVPHEPGMAFVVVLHLSPDHESNAESILQRYTRMPVVQVEQTTPIEADRIYVISPRKLLSMDDSKLVVDQGLRPRGGVHVAIDLFFRTLAEAHRDRAVGIVLSGTGSDGAAGVAKLREQGGVTLAQLPADAQYDGMPRSAIATGCVDFVLPAADMPERLLELWRNARTITLPEDGAAVTQAGSDPGDASEDAFREILALLNARTQHDFDYYKRATLLRRMERRLQVRLLSDLPAYRDYLRDHPEETALLLADILISVTSFFRDREAFETLEREVVPALVEAAAPNEPLRVWVPGCATGEEAYSLAMLLEDEVARQQHAAGYQVFATDIDESAIAIARRGIYPESIALDVPASRLRRYFVKEDGRYRIKKGLRERILFAAHNALRDPPFSRLDLVSCRNLMIYLERSIQEKLLEMFHFSMRRGAALFLGSSESADAAGGRFESIDKKARVYRAVAHGAMRVAPTLPLRVNRLPLPMRDPLRPAARQPFAFDLHQKVLEQYAPPSVIVDTQANIVHMSERMGRFFEHPAGAPQSNLLHIVHPDLRLELRSLLFQATTTRTAPPPGRVRAHLGAELADVTLTVCPLGGEDAPPYMLVLFDEAAAQSAADGGATPRSDAERNITEQLEAELQHTRDQLQATLEQSEVSAEELKASNEELQAINEELRSTTEELETSKEELQSVNEELITVNAELRHKVDETARSNDDLKNFIASSDIATVFVDADMLIQRFTPRATAIFNMIASDVGRPISDITHRLDYPAITADAMRVIETLQPVEKELRSTDGHWYIARLRPYLSSERQFGGVVYTFFDITGLKRAESRLATHADDVRHAIESSNDFGVITLDRAGLITAWSRGAEQVFGFASHEMVGKTADGIFTPEDVAAGVPRKEVEDSQTRGRADGDRWMQRKGGERIFVAGVMTPVDAERLDAGLVKIVRDMTPYAVELRSRERDLATGSAALADARSVAALKDEFLAVMSHEMKHPLNLINVNAEIIVRSHDTLSPHSARALNTILRAVRTQTRIVDDLLDLTRLRTGKFTLELAPVDMAAVARSAVETAAADVSTASLDVQFDADPPGLLVYADVSRLNQIVWNLLNNAIKFTPPSGHITVSVREEEGYGRLDVVDTGQGIEPDFLPRVFDMFGQARLREPGQAGLGIGLSLVKQLIERHGGRVEAYSAGVGQGARFSMWLPQYRARGARREQALERPRQANGLQGLCVLICDDDPATVDSLSVLLDMEGAQVVRCVSAEEALSVAGTQTPDIVLTDLGMPEMDGYALLRALREAGHGMPVVALSGFTSDADLRRTRKAGFSAHIGKPVAIDQLLRTVRELTAPAKAEPKQ